MKSQEISMKLEKKKKKKKKKKIKECYLCYPESKYVFKAKPLFRDCNFTKVYLGHCQTCMMELSYGNS